MGPSGLFELELFIGVVKSCFRFSGIKHLAGQPVGTRANLASDCDLPLGQQKKLALAESPKTCQHADTSGGIMGVATVNTRLSLGIIESHANPPCFHTRGKFRFPGRGFSLFIGGP